MRTGFKFRVMAMTSSTKLLNHHLALQRSGAIDHGFHGREEEEIRRRIGVRGGGAG